MSIILTLTLVYVWVVGGLFITFLAAGEDWRTTTGKRVAILIAIWPLVTTWAAGIMVCEGVSKTIRRFIFKTPKDTNND